MSVKAILSASLMAMNGTMRGVVYNGVPHQVEVQDLPIPTIQNATDVLVRVTSAAICGSDLHYYHGTYGHGTPLPWYMGHEAVGYVTDVGEGVSQLVVGDRVVVPDILHEGHMHSALTTTLGHSFGTGGPLAGCQAEYVRVPLADDNLLVIPPPNGTNQTTSDLDWIMLSDIFNTGWAGLDYAGFQPGDTVAIFGAGPVGLLSAYSAMLRGASRVYSVDHVQSRLDRAASIGAVPIDFTQSDPVEQIMAYEPDGVARTVDCVGFEAVNANLVQQEDLIINQMIRLTMEHGGLGGIGVWPTSSTNTTATPLAGTINTTMTIDMGHFWSKRLTLQSGGVDATALTPRLSSMIAAGQAHPGFVVTQQVGIEDAPEAYRRFDNHEEQKIVIQFPWAQ